MVIPCFFEKAPDRTAFSRPRRQRACKGLLSQPGQEYRRITAEAGDGREAPANLLSLSPGGIEALLLHQGAVAAGS